jgi:hypothetical protein
MATLQDMITRIGTEIRRPSLGTSPTALTSPIASAIFDAIAIWQKDRFRISDVDPSVPPSFNTVVGQSVYTLSNNANISTIYVIDYLNLIDGATSVAADPPHARGDPAGAADRRNVRAADRVRLSGQQDPVLPEPLERVDHLYRRPHPDRRTRNIERGR